MSTFNPTTTDELIAISERKHPAGTEIILEGRLAEIFFDGFKSYAKFKEVRNKSLVAGSAAMLTIQFGPVGWLVGIPALGALWLSMQAKDDAKKQLHAAPLAQCVVSLIDSGFEIKHNDGSIIKLKKP